MEEKILSTAWLEMQAGVQPDWEKAHDYLAMLTEAEAQQLLCETFQATPKDLGFIDTEEAPPVEEGSHYVKALEWLADALSQVEQAWEEETGGFIRYNGKYASFLFTAGESDGEHPIETVELLIAFEGAGLALAAGFAEPDESEEEEAENVN